MKDIKIVFMGTPLFAYHVLKGLIDNYHVVLVVSQPDREKDKKGNLIETPTKKLAKEHDIPVFQPLKIKEEYQKILDYEPDLIVTCAYGQIIPGVIINYPKYGCINVHGSLLPKLRGGAPIHHAIINGDKITGITIMDMIDKMDAGDIISQEKVVIEEDDILDTLYEKMAYVGRDLLLKTIPSLIDGTAIRTHQNEEEVTFGYNIKKEEEKIDFNNSAVDIRNLIRGLNSIPGAYCHLDDKRLKIYQAYVIEEKSSSDPGTIEKIDNDGLIVATQDKLIKITDIKLEGKKRCLVKDFLNGINKESLKGKRLLWIKKI